MPFTRFDDSASMKYRRAQYHYSCLRAEYERLKHRSLRLGPQTYQLTPGTEIVIAPRYQPNQRWGVLVGDCVHDLRSALDHAIFQLVPGTVRAQHADRIEFPVFDTSTKYAEWKAKRANAEWVERVNKRAWEAIDARQPFIGKAAKPRDHILWKLYRLSNLDKHRSIHVALLRIEQVRSSKPFGVQRLEPASGTIHIGSFADVVEGEKVQIELKLRPAFADGEDVARLPLFETLAEIGTTVSGLLNQLRRHMQ